MLRIFLFFFCLCSLLCGCREKSEDCFLEKSFAVQREIVEEFSSVQSLQELLEREEALTHLFTELAILAIQLDHWGKTHKRDKKCSSLSENEISVVLEQEFRRILSIPGAEGFLERCQKKGLDRLDLYLRHKK